MTGDTTPVERISSEEKRNREDNADEPFRSIDPTSGQRIQPLCFECSDSRATEAKLVQNVDKFQRIIEFNAIDEIFMSRLAEYALSYLR